MSAPESSLPVAGTVVVRRAADPGFELLLMRRPDRGSFAGAWVFPGGKVEPGDVREGDDEAEDARRAAIRETRSRCPTLSNRASGRRSCGVPRSMTRMP